MERRPNRPHVLPTGNDPKELSLSPEGRRMLRKEIVSNMRPIWTNVGGLPDTEVERLGNGIMTSEMPRNKLLRVHSASLQIAEGFKDKLPPQVFNF